MWCVSKLFPSVIKVHFKGRQDFLGFHCVLLWSITEVTSALLWNSTNCPQMVPDLYPTEAGYLRQIIWPRSKWEKKVHRGKTNAWKGEERWTEEERENACLQKVIKEGKKKQLIVDDKDRENKEACAKQHFLSCMFASFTQNSLEKVITARLFLLPNQMKAARWASVQFVPTKSQPNFFETEAPWQSCIYILLF